MYETLSRNKQCVSTNLCKINNNSCFLSNLLGIRIFGCVGQPVPEIAFEAWKYTSFGLRFVAVE